MKDMEWLKTRCLGFFNEREESLKRSMDYLYKEERVDEANFEKIRLNVVEIFSKMFSISLADNPEALRARYLSFFDKITKPWHFNREKAVEFGKEMERLVEDIKIQEADKLRNRFEEYFSQLDADQGCAN